MSSKWSHCAPSSILKCLQNIAPADRATSHCNVHSHCSQTPMPQKLYLMHCICCSRGELCWRECNLLVGFLLATRGQHPHPLITLHLEDSNDTCRRGYKGSYRPLGLRSKLNQTPWSESASELYRPSDRRMSAKRLPTCADRRCHVISVTDPSGRILGFLDRSRYFSIK
jgi:hypothetical protein